MLERLIETLLIFVLKILPVVILIYSYLFNFVESNDNESILLDIYVVL